MSKGIKSFISRELEPFEASETQPIVVGGALLFLNILLMFFVGLYWTNSSIHEYIAGRPL